jgi:hypothetical protein
MAGDLWRVEDVRQESRSNVVWAGCFWGADAGSVGEEAEPKAFKFGAFTGKGTKYGRTFSEQGHNVQPWTARLLWRFARW